MRKKVVAIMSAVIALVVSSTAFVGFAAPEIPAGATVKTMDTALANPAQWTFNVDTAASVSENKLTLKQEVGKAIVNPNLGLSATELVQFKWTPHYEAGGNTQFILRSTTPNGDPDIEKNKSEYALYNLYIDNNTGNVYIFYKKDGDTADKAATGNPQGTVAGKAAINTECIVTLGAVDTTDGVRILLYINDDKIIDVEDTATDTVLEGAPIKGQNNFTIITYSSTSEVSAVGGSSSAGGGEEPADPFKDLKVNTINPLLSDPNKWSYKFKGAEVADNKLTFISDEGTVNGEAVATPNCILSSDQLIKFTYNTPATVPFPAGYSVVAFRLGDAALHTGVQNQFYGFLIAAGDGTTQNIWFIYSKDGMAPGGAAVKFSHELTANEDHEIVCGSIKTANGIRNLLFIDGEKVVDLEDTDTDEVIDRKPLETAYNFNFYTFVDDYTIKGAEGTPLDLNAKPDSGIVTPTPDDGSDKNDTSKPDETSKPDDTSKPDETSEPEAPAKTGIEFAVLTLVLLIASAAVVVGAKKAKN